MGVQVASIRARIYDIIGDHNTEDPAIDPFRIDSVINKNAHRIAARTIRPQETVQSITLVVGTYDYALASSVNVDHVAQVFLDADGIELCYVPFELFNSRYKQATSEPAASGTPREYTLWETSSQVMTLRVGPTPDTAADGPIKVYHSVMPTLMSNSDNVGGLSNTATIPFSNELVAALESACASELVGIMTAEKLEKLGLDKSVLIPRWEREVEEGIRSHNLHRLKNGLQQDRVLRTSNNRLSGWFGARS